MQGLLARLSFMNFVEACRTLRVGSAREIDLISVAACSMGAALLLSSSIGPARRPLRAVPRPKAAWWRSIASPVTVHSRRRAHGAGERRCRTTRGVAASAGCIGASSGVLVQGVAAAARDETWSACCFKTRCWQTCPACLDIFSSYQAPYLPAVPQYSPVRLHPGISRSALSPQRPPKIQTAHRPEPDDA